MVEGRSCFDVRLDLPADKRVVRRTSTSCVSVSVCVRECEKGVYDCVKQTTDEPRPSYPPEVNRAR